MPGTYGSLTYGSGTYGDPGGTPAPPPTPASNRFASYKIEVAWSNYLPGVATLDLSTLGGTDTLGGGDTAYIMQQFGGPYDDITARTDNHVRVESVSWTRGRSDDLSEVQALQATITGRDPTGMMNIHNPNSPLNQGVLASGSNLPLRPVRVTATYNGQPYPILFGFMRSLEFEPKGRTGTFSIEVTDLFAMLSQPRKDQPTSGVRPVIPYTTNVTTGQAIGMVLDYVGWRDPSLRALDDGDMLPFFEATGQTSGLELIAGLVRANLGLFYINGAGVAVFADRSSRFTSAIKAGFVNTMKALGSGVSLDSIKNKWTVMKQSRTGPGQYSDGAAQVTSDFASAYAYSEREDSMSSPWFLTDAFALQVSQQLLAFTKDPINPVWQLSVENRDANLLYQMLTVDLLDRVSVQEAATNSQGTFFVEQVSGSITAQNHRHEMRYILSDRSAVAAASLDPFILGTDTLDGAKVLAF